MPRCVECGCLDGHYLWCRSPTLDGSCVIPWCRQRWDHMAPCDERNVTGDPEGHRFLASATSIHTRSSEEGDHA